MLVPGPLLQQLPWMLAPPPQLRAGASAAAAAITSEVGHLAVVQGAASNSGGCDNTTISTMAATAAGVETATPAIPGGASPMGAGPLLAVRTAPPSEGQTPAVGAGSMGPRGGPVEGQVSHEDSSSGSGCDAAASAPASPEDRDRAACTRLAVAAAPEREPPRRTGPLQAERVALPVEDGSAGLPRWR